MINAGVLYALAMQPIALGGANIMYDTWKGKIFMALLFESLVALFALPMMGVVTFA